MLWFVVLCCLKELCMCLPREAHHHFNVCHIYIVHSRQLCSVEMHSLAHFNMCVAFDAESEIQFLMFC